MSNQNLLTVNEGSFDIDDPNVRYISAERLAANAFTPSQGTLEKETMKPQRRL